MSNRIFMDFRTRVDLPKPNIHLNLDAKVILIGSCFAEHMGKRLADSLPEGQVLVNPTGVLYNPESILYVLNGFLQKKTPWLNQTFQGSDGRWHNWMFSNLHSAATREEMQTFVCQQWERGAQMMCDASTYIITTWSTDRVFTLNDQIVANCHKEPGNIFHQHTLDFNHIIHTWKQFMNDWGSHHRLLLTLSPYRYLKWGLSDNGAMKARLRHAIDELCSNHSPQANYFPAYEIITDELRDYRFYDRDMLHPSEVAIDFVWEKFSEWAFHPRLKQFAHEKSALLRDLRHRPLHPNSPATQEFERRCEERKIDFYHRWQRW